MSENVMLQEAIEAVRRGQQARARDLLTRLLRADPSNPEYWLWMSAVVETRKEQIYCLQSVLNIDPDASAARYGLVLLGVSTPAETTVRPVVRRSWSAGIPEASAPTGLRRLWTSTPGRLILLLGTLILVTGFIAAALTGFGRRPSAIASRPSHTPGPSPTFTTTPTMISSGKGGRETPQPTSAGQASLALIPEITYTPTPLFVTTPHPITEAFRSGERAFLRGDLQTALEFFQQAAKIEPGSPDIYYYIGECYRLTGSYELAVQAYNQAVEVDPEFGPAYLGRARALLEDSPRADVSADLDLAVEYAPDFGEAYLQRLAFLLEQGELDAAQDDLTRAQELLPESPLVELYSGQIAFQQGNLRAAAKHAGRALEADQTLLPAYRLLGEAALQTGDPQQAAQALEVYTQYAGEDAAAWAWLGEAYYRFGRYTKAVAALDQAISLDDRLEQAYYFRGHAHLVLDNGQQAVNDFLAARRLGGSASFDIQLGLGRALFAAGRLDEARSLLNASQNLAANDAELAQTYYYRAQVYEASGNLSRAAQDWQALLALPPSSLEDGWAAEARDRLEALFTPTPSPQNTSRPATRTPRPTRTPEN